MTRQAARREASVRAKELLVSAQRTGIEPDPRAGRLFRLAAVRLSNEPTDSEAHRAAAAEAAAALVGLALAEAEDDLRDLLTPDPNDHNVVWTVACYQIGDLTPSALRDFPDPVEAVAVVAACPDETHVAAELVASTSGGLRWTAVLRTNDHLAVQLPTPDTASDGSREHPGDLAAALRRWRERLTTWAEGGGRAVDHDAAAREALRAPMPLGRSPWSFDASVPSELEALEQSISSRLSRLESSMVALVAGVEAANAAAARRDETIRQLEAELLASRAASSHPHVVRDELDALAACVADALQRLDEITNSLNSTSNGPASDA